MSVIKHVSVGAVLDQTEYESGSAHAFDGSTSYDFLDSTGGNLTGPVSLSSGGTCSLMLRPSLDYNWVRKNAVPTAVYRGLVRGYEMPIFASDNQELYFTEPFVPKRWDAASSPVVHIEYYLDTANTDKRFRIQVSACHHSSGDVISTGSQDVEVESTGTWAQYASGCSLHTLDYTTGSGSTDNMTAGDMLNFRVRRVAPAAGGTSEDIAGNVVITGVAVAWQCDKFLASA